MFTSRIVTSTRALLEQNKDKLIVLKYYAKYCVQCQRVMPHYKMLMNNKQNKDKPIIFADIDINLDNKEFIESMNIVGLPTFQLYVHGTVIDSFLCGPSNVRLLKDNVKNFITRYINPKTNTIKS